MPRGETMEGQVRKAAGLAAAFLAAAIVVAPAGATRPDDRAGMLGVGAIAAEPAAQTIRPDDRATARGPGSISVESRTESVIRPDDRAGARGPGSVVVPTSSVSTSDDDGLPWAGIGMGAALFVGLGLVGAALLFTGRYQRHPA